MYFRKYHLFIDSRETLILENKAKILIPWLYVCFCNLFKLLLFFIFLTVIYIETRLYVDQFIKVAYKNMAQGLRCIATFKILIIRLIIFVIILNL